jgi:hypothetical protein
MQLSTIPKWKLITGIVIAGIINLMVLTSVVAGLTTGRTSPSTTPTPVQTPRPSTLSPTPTLTPRSATPAPEGSVLYALHYQLKYASPKLTGYDRDEFGQKWADVDRNGCDQRNDVLRRDMVNLHTVPGTRGCVLAKGTLSLEGDSYAVKRVKYKRGSDKIEIDHVVSLADAWRMGADAWNVKKRQRFANDFMELEAVDARTNQDKGSQSKGFPCAQTEAER